MRVFWKDGVSEGGSALIWKGCSKPGDHLWAKVTQIRANTLHSYCPSLPSILNKQEDWKPSVKRRHIFDKLGSIAISNGGRQAK